MSPWWSWTLTLVGCLGFKLAGKKVWWAWYVNIANQLVWATYAVATRQWGFLFGIPVYLAVFVPNAISWTREHRNGQRLDQVEAESLEKPRDVLVQGNPYVNINTSGGGTVRVPMHYLVKLWKEQHDASSESEQDRTTREAEGEPRQAQG